jgi:hypothetical protein
LKPIIFAFLVVMLVGNQAIAGTVGGGSEKKIDSLILASAKSTKNQQLISNVESSFPIINKLLDSVMTTGKYQQVEIYAAPGGIEGNWLSAWPMNAPKNIPLYLANVGNWSSESANEFGFTANLCSSVSKTCIYCKSKLINNGTGWAIKAVYFSGRYS